MGSQPSDGTEVRACPPVRERRVSRILTHFLTLVRAYPASKIFPALISVAGLAFGLWIRVEFFRSFPDPIPTQDAWGYLTGVFGLLQKGQFDLFAQRTPGFPLIVWLTLIVSGSFAALNILNGILTFIAGLAVAYVARAFGGPFRLTAALAFAFVVVHPHILYWEHFLQTEGSFQAFFTLALCAIALAVLRTTPRHAAAAGLLTAIAVLIRPQAMFLTPLMLLALAWTGRRLGMRKLVWLLVAAGAGPLLLLGGWSARNKVVHGFFGLSDNFPAQIFGVSGRWIDLESPALAEDKALISDSIRRYQSMPDDLDFVLYDESGPGYLIARKYASDPNRRDEVYSALAREAILHHPVAFAKRGLNTTYEMLFFKWAKSKGEFAFRDDHGALWFATVEHPVEFSTNSLWDQQWDYLAREFSVNQYRAAQDQATSTVMSRRLTFDGHLQPVLAWETQFIRGSLIITLIALLSLPWLSGPRRLVVTLISVSVILLIFTAGFFSWAEQRYLSTLHGGAALMGALAVVGLAERWMPKVWLLELRKENESKPQVDPVQS